MEMLLAPTGHERSELMKSALALQERMPPDQWEAVQLAGSVIMGTVVREHANVESLPHPNQVFGKPGREYQILKDFYQIEFDLVRTFQRQKEAGLEQRMPEAHYRRKLDYFRDLTKDIRTRRHHYLIPRLYERLLGSASAIPEQQSVVVGLVGTNIFSLWHLVSQPDRFLVGVKDGIYWKKIKWPKVEDEEEINGENRSWAWYECYFKNLAQIGSRELVLVPEQVIDPRKIEKLDVPQPERTTEELLEDAFYQQRYMIPHQGARVLLRRSGDLREMVLMQISTEIWAKTISEQGEFQLGLNLDTAEGWVKPRDDNLSEQREAELINKLAEVYNILVTAVEIPDEELETQVSTRREIRDQDRKRGRSRAVYIPRIIRADHRSEIRTPFEGPKRPATPHQVQGHRRRANMTERHRQAILKFEQEHGILILRNLPAGYTFVRPFVVPKDAEISMRDLPTFIKRRIETKLAQELQKPSIEPFD